jgi:hypothetical protein
LNVCYVLLSVLTCGSGYTLFLGELTKLGPKFGITRAHRPPSTPTPPHPHPHTASPPAPSLPPSPPAPQLEYCPPQPKEADKAGRAQTADAGAAGPPAGDMRDAAARCACRCVRAAIPLSCRPPPAWGSRGAGGAWGPWTLQPLSPPTAPCRLPGARGRRAQRAAQVVPLAFLHPFAHRFRSQRPDQPNGPLAQSRIALHGALWLSC